MRINCPYCGPRDLAEFTYQGDGNRRVPTPPRPTRKRGTPMSTTG